MLFVMESSEDDKQMQESSEEHEEIDQEKKGMVETDEVVKSKKKKEEGDESNNEEHEPEDDENESEDAGLDSDDEVGGLEEVPKDETEAEKRKRLQRRKKERKQRLKEIAEMEEQLRVLREQNKEKKRNKRRIKRRTIDSQFPEGAGDRMRHFGRMRAFDFMRGGGREMEYHQDRLEQKHHRENAPRNDYESDRHYGRRFRDPRHVMFDNHSLKLESMRELEMMEYLYRREHEGSSRWMRFTRHMMPGASSSSETSDNSEEERLEVGIRNRKYLNMKEQDLSTVFVTKKMFSTKVLLGDSYTVGRYCEICEEIKNDIPFYSAMVLVAAQNHTSARSSRPAGTEDDCNKTPLHFACELNDKDCVEVLVNFKAKTEKKDDNDNTPLLLAMQHGACEEIVRLVLSRPKMKLIEHVNKLGFGLLSFHGLWFNRDNTQRSNAKALRYLLEYAKEHGELDALMNHRHPETGRLPLHEAIYVGNTENLKILIEFGADVNARLDDADYKYKTVGHLAAQFSNVMALKALLEGGAAPDIQDSDGKSILQSALTNYYSYDVETNEMFNCLCLLAEHGANINAPINPTSGTTLLHFACTRPKLAVKLVECGGNVLLQDNAGSSALSNAEGRSLIIYEEEAFRMKTLSECCKWTIRQSMGHYGPIRFTVQKLPLPKHLQDYIVAIGNNDKQPEFEDTKNEIESSSDMMEH